MHAVTNRSWILFLGTLVCIGTLGCRGSRPFGSIVKVTQETGMPEIDAPEQRLATPSPRSNATKSSAKPTAESATNVVQTNATESSPSPSRDQVAAKRSISSLPATESVADNSKPQPQPSVAPVSTELPESKTAAAKSEIAAIELPAGDAEDLMSAFKDYPPEVQQEALRRLVATTALSAERSDQPESITAKLEARRADLPELPDAAAGDPNAAPPKRIASDRQSSSSVVPAARPASSSGAVESEPVRSRLTDIATSELEPAVTQVSDDQRSAASGEVKPAIVASGSDESVVAQASIEREMEASPTSASLIESENEQSEPDPGLSDAELFSHLVQHLAKAPEGESEADRASRMIKLRHLMVLSGDPDSAVERIDGMGESEQEYLRHQLLGLWTMIDPQGHPVPSRRFSTAISQIREAAKFAAASTDSLEVRSLAFCTEIESYGQVKPFKSNRFDAGQQVILYCEIENFTAVKNEDGFETHLQGSYDLFNEKDEKVVSQLLPADQQTSANYLRDYFIAYQMHLPEQLSKGKYRLQLTMEDVNGKKYGQANIPLEIKK